MKIIFLALICTSGVVYGQSADVVEGCVPLTVNFTGSATATTYFWDFKDGVTSNLKNPSNIFIKPGVYDVTFHESVGGPVLKTMRITVFKKTEVNIEKVSSGCYPFNSEIKSVVTIDPKVTINKYIWIFGDGTSDQGTNLSSVKHTYTSRGEFSISVSVETNYASCSAAKLFNKAVNVFSPPVASFTTNPANLVTCNSSLDVTFSNKSISDQALSYLWDFNNGKTSTLANPPKQTYTTNSYTPKLTVKFAADLPGCQSTASTSVSVGRPIPFIKKAKDTICIYDTLRLISTSVGKKLWTVDANSIIKRGSTRDTVVIYFSKAGDHSVTLQVTTADGKCSDQSSVSVYVDEVLASIQHTPQNSCSSPITVQYKADVNQANVNYLWKFNDKTTSTNSTASKTYTTKNGKRYYDLNDLELQVTELIVTSKKTGCKTTDEVLSVDSLWLPAGRIMPNVSMGCAPLTVTFSDVSKSFDPIVKWEWLFGDGTKKVNALGKPETITFNQVGKYENRIIVTTQKGCIDTSYAAVIEVGANITGLDFTASKTDVCPGETVLFNTIMPSNIGNTAGDIKGYHFTTEGNRSFHCSNEKDLTWSYNYLSGPQDVSLTVDAGGCLTTIKKPAYVNVKGTIAKIDYSAACNDPYKYHFKNVNTNAASVTWDFGDAAKGAPANTGTAINETHLYTKSGDYKVTLTATSSECPATKDSVIVKARKVKANLLSDSAFCLNGRYFFNAGTSVDVDAQCHKGYDWKVINSDIRRSVSASPVTDFEFKKAGNFIVQLIVADVNGCKDTLARKIKVFDITAASKVDDNLICNPATVKFTDLSVGDTTLVAWNWDFGDGTTSSLQNPSHTYTLKPSSGSEYKVVLIVQDKIGCKDTIPLTIKQYEPTSAIDVKSKLCLGETATFNASDYTQGGSNLKFNWDFGNGASSTQQLNNKILYANDQIYKVVLNIEEVSSGCKAKITQDVSVQTYPKAAFATNVDSIKFLCAPRAIIFSDSSKSKYPITYNYWKFDNGEFSTGKGHILSYNKGNYNVQHIVTTENGCSDTIVRIFKVYGPEARIEFSEDRICKGDTILFNLRDTVDVIAYEWGFGDGTVVSNVTPVKHKYNFHPPGGETIAKLSLIGSYGCSLPIDHPIYIHQVISDFARLDGIDTSTCFKDGPYSLTNKSTGADAYYWDFGDGQTSTVQNVNTHAYANPGTYDVSLAIKNQSLQCVDTITKKIVIFKNPVVQAIGDTVCQDKGVVALHVLNPDPTSAFQWTPSTGLSSTTATSPIATIQHSVHYEVLETDKNGCTDKTTVPAIIIESIGLRSLDTSIVIGDIITLPVNGASYYRYSWKPDTGLSCVTCNYPTVQPLEDIRYDLLVTDVRGCYTDPYFYNIKIKPETFVKMPSMFTPNGDGNNDVVYAKGWGIKDLLEYQIFNRWGQLIFTTSDIQEGWDGTFNGALQSSDIYVYKIKAMTWRNTEVKVEGYINLVR